MRKFRWCKKLCAYLCLLMLLGCTAPKHQAKYPIKISDNQRYFTNADGSPFFWLGDTGWLLFTKLNRDECKMYLDNRAKKGFNVIQIMVLHTLDAVNVYGDSALVNQNVTIPKVTDGNNPSDSVQYDYWDHVDFVVKEAAKRGINIALVPVWGGNVKHGKVTVEQARKYATWLANRYKNDANIIWLNGGDIRGDDSANVWNAIGESIKLTDPNHLMTFHPRGRTASSIWFQNMSWLDFNMFQSGHRNYAQDTAQSSFRFGEDNWRYVDMDYAKEPVKPTLDGEPSYEDIPQGLHDTLMPRWTANDVRRYAYWSVFAGAAGFTYGHNSVIQFHRPTDKKVSYGAKMIWTKAINDVGAGQMIYLKQLMLSESYFDRVPDQSLIAGGQGERYDHLVATRGNDFAMIYTYTGAVFDVNMGKIKGDKVEASWFNPRDGLYTSIGEIDNKGVHKFDPPGDKSDGNDWVLVLQSE